MGWPARGVYFFFEPGEVREDGVTPRIVRVGTHGLTRSKSTLWGRLSQHRGRMGGRMPGGGNHRGSIFRLHVGMALVDAGRFPDPPGSWGARASAPREVREAEHALEQAVSSYIGSMPFLWVPVKDEPSPASDRGLIERGAISTLSNLDREPIDPPSPTWLGRHARRQKIARSGLWNVNHVDDEADFTFLPVLEHWVLMARRNYGPK